MDRTTDGLAGTSAATDSRCGPASQHALVDEELRADVEVLAAVGNETRYEVLRLVAAADTEVCVCELEAAMPVSQGAVSQALSRLYAAGLVTRRKDGRWRYYSTTPGADRFLDVLDEIRRTADA